MSQDVFAAALLAPALTCPPGLTTWNGSDPGRRFAIYRNNVIVSLIDALADSFPVTEQLVGEDFFRAMARLFAVGHPPRSPLMAFYGADFPAFIEAFPPAAGLPYLADVARLERLRIDAYHAADAEPLAAAAIAAALADPDTLPGLRLGLHPSLGVLISGSAVASLWAAHQGVLELSTVVPDRPETALVLRHGLDVEVIAVPPATGRFIAALQHGTALGEAAAMAASDAGFDLSASLALLIHKGALSALHTSRSPS